MKILSSLYFIKLLLANLKGFYCQLKIGQTIEAEILQTSHRIEKGLLIKNPKPRWGWEKIRRLMSLSTETKDPFAQDVCNGIISEYAKNKKNSPDSYDKSMASSLRISDDSTIAGIMQITAKDVLTDIEAGKKLFLTRHSIRDFDARKVSEKDILAAVELANLCPSACNRQISKVYVVDGDLRHQFFEADVDDVFPPQFVLITADINAFIMEEFYDWIVSSSIFAGYLSLAFHLYGIGSCCLRKPLYFELESMKKYREHFHIPQNEQIVLEMAIGYYKDSFSVARSARKPVSDIVVFDKQ